MGFKFSISTSPTCDVTVFVKWAQNGQFSFRIFPQDFRDFELKAHISGLETDIDRR